MSEQERCPKCGAERSHDPELLSFVWPCCGYVAVPTPSDYETAKLYDAIDKLEEKIARQRASLRRLCDAQQRLKSALLRATGEAQMVRRELEEARAEIERLRRERETLAEALRELVTLKDHLKHADPAEYERRKPAAWEMARTALALLDGEKGGGGA